MARSELAALSPRSLLRLQRDPAEAVRREPCPVTGPGRWARRLPVRAGAASGSRAVGDGNGGRPVHRHAFQLLPGALHVEAARHGVGAIRDLRRRRQRCPRAAHREQVRPASILPDDQPAEDSRGRDRRGRRLGGRDGDRRVGDHRPPSASRHRPRRPRRRECAGGRPRRVTDEANRRGQGFVEPDPGSWWSSRPAGLDPVSADPRLFLRDDVPDPAMTRPVNVAILGATGSIGQQTLDVIDRNAARLRLFGLTEGRRSTKRIAEYLIQGQAGEPDFDARVEAMVTDPRCDLVVVAIPGARALAPTLAALTAGKEVALATKEVLVMAGALVMRAAGERGIRPVDSEHSAIWQCLWGERRESIRRLILTASGGPFWAHPDLDLDQVTVEQALNHPRWSMGPKVTVDSATLMNKGLEVIEAHHLYAISLDRIAVCVHPQSVVHSLVEFVDGSFKAQLGRPDMRLPIAVALAYPDRLPDAVPPTSIHELSGLEFHELDEGRIPSVRLAREAAAKGGGHPAVLNAANEEAVNAFLAGEIPFSAIIPTVERTVDGFPGGGSTLSEILEADRWARAEVKAKFGTVRRA